MGVTRAAGFLNEVLHDEDGNVIDSVLTAGIRRLAVDASLSVSEIQIGAVELDDGAGSERASIKDDGVAISPTPNAGGLLMSGSDSGTQRYIAVNGSGQIVTAPAAAVPVSNEAAVTMRTVTVVTAGVPVQGPTVTIPDGFGVVVKNRSTQAGSPQAFVADSAANAVLAANRFEMLKGESVEYKITNMNLLFFDSDTNGTIIELTAEQ